METKKIIELKIEDNDTKEILKELLKGNEVVFSKEFANYIYTYIPQELAIFYPDLVKLLQDIKDLDTDYFVIL